MASKTCFFCGQELNVKSGKEAACLNPACQSGGQFVKCGFCGEWSFAVRPESLMRCINPDCKFFDVVRGLCPVCKKASRIVRRGATVCLNRSCPENCRIVKKCFFCGNTSFLHGDKLMFCTKGECAYLLKEMAECKVCGNMSRVVETGKCMNSECREP